MRKLEFLLVGSVCCVLGASSAHATPSSTYWTPCTTDVQPFGKWHITYDSYFTVGRTGTKKGDFPTDLGLTVGVLPYEKLNLEVGFDLLEPTDDPLFFNAKLGTPEGSLFAGSPALNVGIFNVGTKSGVTDFEIVDFLVGKTLPHDLGRLFAGAYVGSDTLRSADGDVESIGWMVGYDKGFWPAKQGDKEFKRFVAAADYASGENAIGGGGVGLYVYFTPDIDLLMGPVWFNDARLNGDLKWTVQLDINF
jgi:hypothetical protein